MDASSERGVEARATSSDGSPTEKVFPEKLGVLSVGDIIRGVCEKVVDFRYKQGKDGRWKKKGSQKHPIRFTVRIETIYFEGDNETPSIYEGEAIPEDSFNPKHQHSAQIDARSLETVNYKYAGTTWSR